MKRTVVIWTVLAVMAACLGGCIISATPSPSTMIPLKVGVSQTFAVSGFFNGPYTWYKNNVPIPAATGESYTYTALAGDQGVNKIKVETLDFLNGQTLVTEWTVEVVADLPPIAVAGPNQDVAPGSTVQLDGSASKDPEEQPLNYLWEIVGRPAGSNAALSDPKIANPTFIADVDGAYTIRLIVNDGTNNSEGVALIVKAYTENEQPTVEAGDDQTVLYGPAVTLDGSASLDPEGQPLTYAWKIESQPAGSTVVLSDPASDKPSFTPNRTGQYVVSLIVNDGQKDSGIDWVTIIVQNTAPAANAGPNITIADVGGTAELDGSDSNDPDGTALTYQWSITSRPLGSTAVLINPTGVDPTFTPDKKGAYVIKLEVSDGNLSDVDTVIVTYSNHVPVAEAGADITLPFGGTTQLSGSGTDPDGDPLTYAWTIIQKPNGSTATLSSATAAKPTFKPDRKGIYLFELKVTDNEGLVSAPDTVKLTTTNHAPSANAGSDINLHFPGTTQLSGSGSDADGDPLTYQWTVVSYPAGSSPAVLSNTTSANAAFTPDIKGDYVFSLVVNDGEENSLAATVAVHVYNNQPVANAGAGSTLVFGATATLNGGASYDPDGTALNYAWTMTSCPAGSTATLSSAAASPTFKPDRQGHYEFSLVVFDGDLYSGASTVTIDTFTYNQGFESDIAFPWGVTTTPAGFPYNLTGDQKHSGARSFQPGPSPAGNTNNNEVILSLNLPQPTYVYSISAWLRRTTPSAIHSELIVDGVSLSNGTPPPREPHGDGIVHNLDPDSTTNWVQRTWAINRPVSTISFVYSDQWNLVDKIYLDDIEINTWGN